MSKKNTKFAAAYGKIVLVSKMHDLVKSFVMCIKTKGFYAHEQN